MPFKLSNLNSNLALTLGYLNPAMNNSVLVFKVKRESLRMIQSNGRVTEATATERDTVSQSFYLLF